MSLYSRVQTAARARDASHDGGGLAVRSDRFEKTKMDVKRAMMDRVGFTELTRLSRAADVPHAREELRPALEAVLNADASSGELTGAERGAVIREVLDEVVGLGPLQPFMEDDSITEVMVNGRASTYTERAGVLHEQGQLFETDEQIRIAIDRIISPLGRRVDERSPR